MEALNLRFAFLAFVLVLQYDEVSSKTALIIIDVQNCFLSGGSLAVTNGDNVIPVINSIRRKYASEFDLTVLSQDWHCADHVSFASRHENMTAFSVTYLTYDQNETLCEDSSCDVTHNISQTLWPDHCIMNTEGANFSTSLVREPADIVIRKGNNCDVDSYSAFFDNGGFSHTELNSILQQHNISTLVITGLALDFCVYYTSIDGKNLGYTVYTVLDASKPVAEESKVAAVADMRAAGIHLITSDELDDVFGVSAGPRQNASFCTTLLTLISFALIVTKSITL